MEPTIYDTPNENFLKKVRKIADQNDALLIFDEIITGFRFDLQGGQKFFDVKADLVCFGKGMGNGLPIAAITGPTEFMKIFDKLWVSSTNNSESLSLAGTKAVIMEMNEKNTISHCWNIGNPVRMFMTCNDSKENASPTLKALVLQEMVKKGIFMSPSVVFNSYSHSIEDIEKTLNIFNEVCLIINNIVKNDNFKEHIEGKMPTTVWTMKHQSIRKK